MRKSKVDQILKIVSNDYCLGVGKGTGEENGNSTNGSSSEGVFSALSIVSITIILGAVAATTFCLLKRRQKSQNKEKEVIDEDENPVYGLYNNINNLIIPHITLDPRGGGGVHNRGGD